MAAAYAKSWSSSFILYFLILLVISCNSVHTYLRTPPISLLPPANLHHHRLHVTPTLLPAAAPPKNSFFVLLFIVSFRTEIVEIGDFEREEEEEENNEEQPVPEAQTQEPPEPDKLEEESHEQEQKEDKGKSKDPDKKEALEWVPVFFGAYVQATGYKVLPEQPIRCCDTCICPQPSIPVPLSGWERLVAQIVKKRGLSSS